MDKSRRVETWMSEVNALRQNVERKKLIEEKTEKEIMNFELENDEMSENIKSLNGQLSELTQAGFKIFDGGNISPTIYCRARDQTYFVTILKLHHERQAEYDDENSKRNSHRKEFNSKLDQKHDLSSKKSHLIENHMSQKESLQNELAKEKDAFNLVARETDDVLDAEKKQRTELEEVNEDIINLKKTSNKTIQKFIGKLQRRRDRKSDHENNIADCKQKKLETNNELKGLILNTKRLILIRYSNKPIRDLLKA